MELLCVKPLLKPKSQYNVRAIFSIRIYVMKFIVCLQIVMPHNCRSPDTTRKTRACWVFHSAQTLHSCVFRYTLETRFLCVFRTQHTYNARNLCVP